MMRSQFVPIQLLFVIGTQMTEKTLSNVTISDGTGSFLDYAQYCNGSFPNSSIFNKEGHIQVVSTMKSNGTLTAWLPLRRKNLTEWTWLSGEIYGPALTNAATAKAGYDCGVLWKGDGMIIDYPCHQQLHRYICSSSIFCTAQVENMELHCLEISGKAYRIYGEKVTWFEAKQACHERNSTLASFEKKNYEDIISAVKKTEEPVDKTWIGLRLTDYVYQIPGFDKEDVNFYMWQTEGPCVCPEKACAIISKQNNMVQWKAEHCGSSHHFMCGGSDATQPLTHSKKHDDKGRVSLTLIIVISTVAGIALVTLTSICACRRFKKYKSRKDRNQGQMTEKGMLLKNKDSDVCFQRMNILNKENKSTLLKEAKKLRSIIEGKKILGKENKNILFVGLTGTGKSSLISSLITSLTPGPYQAVAEPGDFGDAGKAFTWFLEPIPFLKPLDRGSIQNQNQPVFWDCPGFLDDNSESTVDLLMDIIRGNFVLSTKIPDIIGTTKYKKSEENNNASNTCSKMDLIIFVHDCKTNVPEHLAAAVVQATRNSQDYKIPYLLVINKIDTVSEDSESLEKVTSQVSKALGLFKQADRIFQLSCYFAEENQKEIKRNTQKDKYMCALWKKLLSRLYVEINEHTYSP